MNKVRSGYNALCYQAKSAWSYITTGASLDKRWDAYVNGQTAWSTQTPLEQVPSEFASLSILALEWQEGHRHAAEYDAAERQALEQDDYATAMQETYAQLDADFMSDVHQECEELGLLAPAA